MVTTRRQSGSVRRPLKRQKTSKTDNSNDVKATSRHGRVSPLAILTTMPLDILYEVFGHLRPLDLLHLSRINKGLRKILMSRQSTSVWKTARQRITGFPPCPSDLSEPQYARLAFEKSCHGCGKSRPYKIDWSIRIRGCQSCLDNLLVGSASFEQRYPDLPREIMDLLPYTKRVPNSMGHLTSSRFFWEPTILSMAEQLKTLENNEGVDALETLRKFKVTKKAEVSNIFSHVQLYEKWRYHENANESIATRDRRRHDINKKLWNLHWTLHEISAISHHPVFHSSHGLTKKIWTRIKPQLELERDIYYEQHKETILAERRSTVQNIYRNYVAGAALPHRALPRPLEVFEFEGVAGLIGAPLNADIQESDYTDMREKFPIFIAQWESVQAQRLHALLAARPSNCKSSLSPLKLAVNVLKCGDCLTFVLFSDALAHGCATFRKDLTFWDSVSNIIRNIIIKLGLDPYATTDADLDSLDPRLFCLKCTPKLSKDGTACRVARSWRSCVDHFRLDHINILEPQWRVLNEVQTKQVKDAEGPNADHMSYAWYCNICVDLTPKDLNTYAATATHLRMMHQRELPVLGVDIARDPSIYRRRNFSFLFADPDMQTEREVDLSFVQ